MKDFKGCAGSPSCPGSLCRSENGKALTPSDFDNGRGSQSVPSRHAHTVIACRLNALMHVNFFLHSSVHVPGALGLVFYFIFSFLAAGKSERFTFRLWLEGAPRDVRNRGSKWMLHVPLSVKPVQARGACTSTIKLRIPGSGDQGADRPAWQRRSPDNAPQSTFSSYPGREQGW